MQTHVRYLKPERAKPMQCNAMRRTKKPTPKCKVGYRRKSSNAMSNAAENAQWQKVSSMSSSEKTAAPSSSLIERGVELHRDVPGKARLAALIVGDQNLRNLARRLQVVLADHLDAQ